MFHLTIKHNDVEISFRSEDLQSITPIVEPVVKTINAPAKKPGLKNRFTKSGKRLGRPPKVQSVA